MTRDSLLVDLGSLNQSRTTSHESLTTRYEIRNMDIEVNIGKIAVSNDSANLVSSGIGSCLVITLYDAKRLIGALAHAMLPTRDSSFVARGSSYQSRMTNPESRIPNPEIRDTKYVDMAIDEMLQRMEYMGSRREDIEAKLVGGANMFSAFEHDIGKENVLSAKEKLKKEGIKFVGEAVGGSQGRSVEFSASSGIITVKVKF